MLELFAQLRNDFSIVRLCEKDVRGDSDHWRVFRELVLQNERMYPGIGKWVDRKVGPELDGRKRIAYIGYDREKPVVSAVVYRDRDAKFCHLRIGERLHEHHLGEVFFALMALEVRGIASRVHFTLPEGLWEAKRPFFRSFAFARADKTQKQYRLFEDEFRCSASFSRVWRAVLSKLPKLWTAFSVGGYSIDNGLVMSIRPQYAERLFTGRKSVEIRKGFARHWQGQRVTLYATSPAKRLVGEARIEKVFIGAPDEVWKIYGEGIGCARSEFDEYTGTARKISAVVMRDVRPFHTPLSIRVASELVAERLKPPQTHQAVHPGSGWANAISLAALLQSRFGSRMCGDSPAPVLDGVY